MTSTHNVGKRIINGNKYKEKGDKKWCKDCIKKHDKQVKNV